MNILLDTNIIIPLEDTSRILDTSFAELRKLSAEQQHCLYIHPIQFEDINRDKNQERQKIVLSRLRQYSQIENPPILSAQECYELGLSQSNDNDKVDNNVLFALYRGAVHLLVTNDEGIHKKALRIGLQDKVYRLEQFLLLLRRYTTVPFSFDYTGVKERFLYEINKNQPFSSPCVNHTLDSINGFRNVPQTSENAGVSKTETVMLPQSVFINTNRILD